MSPKEPHPGAGHRSRLRDKFMSHGLGKFTDEEVLELLLTLATPRRDCKQPARKMLAMLGSLQAVMDAEPSALSKVKGVGPRNILGIKLIPAVARRYLEDRVIRHQGPFDRKKALDYLSLTLRPLTKEVFRVMLLDAQARVQAVEDLATGTLTESAVYPREVVARALAMGSRAIVCAHNHPSGNSAPSQMDRRFTRLLFHALKGVEVELVDHLIVGEGENYYSFAEAGEIAALDHAYEMLNL